jgi:hypothetical protein
VLQAVKSQADRSAGQHGVAAVDLEELLGSSSTATGTTGARSSLLGVLGVDPFAGLDPATREIAQSRQFGERLLFNLQRLPFLIRLNGELLANDVAQDIELDRVVVSLERASLAMSQMALTASALPGEIDAQRVRLLADVRAESERLGTLAREYRQTFEAATLTVTSTDQALQTFNTVADRFDRGDEASDTGRPFDITEYDRTAKTISQAALSLTGLLNQFGTTLDSPALGNLSPQLSAVLREADDRSRNLLYTAFALGCGLIAVTCLAVIATAKVLRR